MYPSSFFSTQYFPTNDKSSKAPPTAETAITSARTRRYCDLLSHNVNNLNFCPPKPCYAFNENAPWIKRRVRWQDNADFSINNRISENTQYFGGEYNRLHYSSYTPYQYDPTWEDPAILRHFPNGIKGRPGTFTVTDL